MSQLVLVQSSFRLAFVVQIVQPLIWVPMKRELPNGTRKWETLQNFCVGSHNLYLGCIKISTLYLPPVLNNVSPKSFSFFSYHPFSGTSASYQKPTWFTNLESCVNIASKLFWRRAIMLYLL